MIDESIIISVKKIISLDIFLGYKVVFGGEENSFYVPHEPLNRHYQQIQEWVAEGNTIEEVD
jgi:hypothetical protein